MILKEKFKAHQVHDCRDIADFLSKYYKQDRYTGRGGDYAATLLKSHMEDLVKNGYDIISHHDSVTGKIVAFFQEGIL